MKDEYVMGIDNGGTVTKAAIYDRNGSVVSIASKSTRMLTPREFHTERDITELWAANIEVIKKRLSNQGSTPVKSKESPSPDMETVCIW
ncbi:putative L-xylulose kinase [Klebsiella pneumoniae subsp. pneumoniae]|uniref:Putative L-xylulose kinase n=1 Tax=Klebsiella pneumoniae subsp. pneumoniae TaxID=72407 RepID=A0A378ALY8_KLEPN|nr:putative L-xylulose kinase [Klebsiella pneumoniae subsp. pneumoniae]